MPSWLPVASCSTRTTWLNMVNANLGSEVAVCRHHTAAPATTRAAMPAPALRTHQQWKRRRHPECRTCRHSAVDRVAPLVIRRKSFVLGFGTVIDHLVYATPDLDAAVEWLAAALGVRPTPGGR